MCCAKLSPYQHLAHHTALCQLGPQCQDCQRMTGAQTHFLTLHLAHGFIIMQLSLLHQTAESVNLPTSCERGDRFMSRLREHCVFLLLCSNFTPLSKQNLTSFEEVVGGGWMGAGGAPLRHQCNPAVLSILGSCLSPFLPRCILSDQRSLHILLVVKKW